jgi:hypothetical protein
MLASSGRRQLACALAGILYSHSAWPTLYSTVTVPGRPYTLQSQCLAESCGSAILWSPRSTGPTIISDMDNMFFGFHWRAPTSHGSLMSRCCIHGATWISTSTVHASCSSYKDDSRQCFALAAWQTQRTCGWPAGVLIVCIGGRR